MTVEAVARKLWGEEYFQHLQDRAASKSRALGFYLGWKSEPLPNAPKEIFVHSQQAETFYRNMITKPEPAGWVVAGPARSGKTWMVWDVVTQLVEQEGWHAAVFHRKAALNNNMEIRRIAGTMLEIVDELLPGELNRIMVLDGLVYEEDLDELDEVIWSAARSSGIHIVVVKRSDAFSQWKPTLCHEEMPIVGNHAHRQFVDRLVDQYPAVVAAAGVTKSELLGDTSLGTSSNPMELANIGRQFHDIWWTVEQARGTASLDMLREKLTADITPAQNRALERVAYSSIYGFDIPIENTSNIPKAVIENCSILLDESTDRVKIHHPCIAYAITGNYLENRPKLDQQIGAEKIAPILKEHIARYDYKNVLNALTCLSSGWHTTLRTLLFGARVAGKHIDPLLDEEELKRLIEPAFFNTPTAGIELLSLLSDYFQPSLAIRLLSNVLALLNSRLTQKAAVVEASEINLCLKGIHNHLGLFWDYEDDFDVKLLSSEVQAEVVRARKKWDQFQHLMTRGGCLYKTLDSEPDTLRRVSLAESIQAFDNLEFHLEIQSLYELLLDGASELSEGMFSHAKRILDVVSKSDLVTEANNFGGDGGEPSDGSDALIQTRRSVVEIVSQKGPTSDFSGICEFCDWFVLSMELRIFERADGLTNIFEDLAEKFSELVHSSELREINRGLNTLYRTNAATLIRLINHN